MIFHCFPDGLCVSGSSAGQETDSSLVRRVKAVSGFVPVFCNTGCTKENVVEKLSECDGACVGTAFLRKMVNLRTLLKKQRVMEFMDVVKAYRCTMKEWRIDVALFFRN